MHLHIKSMEIKILHCACLQISRCNWSCRPDHPNTSFRDVLTIFLSQTDSHAVRRSSHPCDGRSLRSLCSLLQALPALHTNPDLCNNASNISWTDTSSRSLRFHTSRSYYYTSSFTLRDLILLQSSLQR